MVTVREASPSATGTSMYRRTVAPPGAGRYSTPSNSRPSDSTVGPRSCPVSLVFWLMEAVVLQRVKPDGREFPDPGNDKRPVRASCRSRALPGPHPMVLDRCDDGNMRRHKPELEIPEPRRTGKNAITELGSGGRI